MTTTTADLLLMGGVHTHTQHALERKRVLFRHRKDGVQGISILRLDHTNGLKAGDRSGPRAPPRQSIWAPTPGGSLGCVGWDAGTAASLAWWGVIEL